MRSHLPRCHGHRLIMRQTPILNHAVAAKKLFINAVTSSGLHRPFT